MSVKGDARSEAPSSEARNFSRLLSAGDRYAGLGFAGFVVVHFAFQAMRAHGEGSVPEAGPEARPAVVVGLSLAIVLPFAVFAWRRLSRGIGARSADTTEKARALDVLEYFTLGVVLLFMALHAAEIVWPLLSGAFDPSDVRPELVAMLSSTAHGLPLVAVAYLCGTGATAFFAARQALRAEAAAAEHSPARARTLVALFVVTWLLGSYAVIRCASGVILS